MKPSNDGGPAFPIVSDDLCAPGMTLRDYFAAAALTGLLADPNGCGTTAEYANVTYQFADAMLAERAKTKEAQP